MPPGIGYGNRPKFGQRGSAPFSMPIGMYGGQRIPVPMPMSDGGPPVTGRFGGGTAQPQQGGTPTPRWQYSGPLMVQKFDYGPTSPGRDWVPYVSPGSMDLKDFTLPDRVRDRQALTIDANSTLFNRGRFGGSQGAPMYPTPVSVGMPAVGGFGAMPYMPQQSPHLPPPQSVFGHVQEQSAEQPPGIFGRASINRAVDPMPSTIVPHALGRPQIPMDVDTSKLATRDPQKWGAMHSDPATGFVGSAHAGAYRPSYANPPLTAEQIEERVATERGNNRIAGSGPYDSGAGRARFGSSVYAPQQGSTPESRRARGPQGGEITGTGTAYFIDKDGRRHGVGPRIAQQVIDGRGTSSSFDGQRYLSQDEINRNRVQENLRRYVEEQEGRSINEPGLTPQQRADRIAFQSSGPYLDTRSPQEVIDSANPQIMADRRKAARDRAAQREGSLREGRRNRAISRFGLDHLAPTYQFSPNPNTREESGPSLSRADQALVSRYTSPEGTDYQGIISGMQGLYRDDPMTARKKMHDLGINDDDLREALDGANDPATEAWLLSILEGSEGETEAQPAPVTGVQGAPTPTPGMTVKPYPYTTGPRSWTEWLFGRGTR